MMSAAAVVISKCHDIFMILRQNLHDPWWGLYRQAWLDACQDGWQAIRSWIWVVGLTIRPLWILLQFILQSGSQIGLFLSRYLGYGIYISMQQTSRHVLWSIRRVVQWQSSLSVNQVKVELLLMTTMILLWMLRRHIEQQGYVRRVTQWYQGHTRRVTQWYQGHKRTVIQKYRSCVDRVSRTSLVLAMILPHALFVGVGLIIKLLFPSIVTWLANETYAILILSQIYPWIWTISLLFQYRHAASSTKANDLALPSEEKSKPPISPSVKSVSDKYEKAVLRTSTSRINNRIPIHNKVKASPKVFPRTASKINQDAKQAAMKKQTFKPVQRLVQARQGESNAMEQDATYWLQYWMIHCLFTAACRVIYLLPIVGRFVSRTQLLRTASMELKLFVYVWIYGLSSILTSTATTDADLQRSYVVRPLPYLSQKVVPVIRNLYQSTSHTVSTESWNSLVERVKSFLSIAVMVRLLSETSQKRILELLNYSHPFVVPAMTLLMPGFITEYGVLYVNTIIPAAKNVTSLSETMASLQYWTLHILLSAMLSSCSSVLWWIPFSTHVIFVLWCHLQYTSCRYYTILEQELQAFGLLPKGEADVVPVDQTVTAIMFRALAKSLPSASQVDTVVLPDAVAPLHASMDVDITMAPPEVGVIEKTIQDDSDDKSNSKETTTHDCQAVVDVGETDISKPGQDCDDPMTAADNDKTNVNNNIIDLKGISSQPLKSDQHDDFKSAADNDKTNGNNNIIDLKVISSQPLKSDQRVANSALPPVSSPSSASQSSSVASRRNHSPQVDIIKENKIRRSTRLKGKP